MLEAENKHVPHVKLFLDAAKREARITCLECRAATELSVPHDEYYDGLEKVFRMVATFTNDHMLCSRDLSIGQWTFLDKGLEHLRKLRG